MMKFDHLNLPVSNLERSRAWYVGALGLKVEFEVPDTRTVALNDGEGFAIFLQEKPGAAAHGVALWFQVDDVDAAYTEWRARRGLRARAPKEFLGLRSRARRPRRLPGASVGRALDEGEVMSPNEPLPKWRSASPGLKIMWGLVICLWLAGFAAWFSYRYFAPDRQIQSAAETA